MVRASFREVGNNWPQLARQMVFWQVRGKQNLLGKGNDVKQGMEELQVACPGQGKAHQLRQQWELYLQSDCEGCENQADEFGFSLLCNEASPKVLKPKRYEERAASISKARQRIKSRDGDKMRSFCNNLKRKLISVHMISWHQM